MRLISLNIWAGKRLPELLAYLKQEAHTTNIFCFQEMLVTTSDIKETPDGRADSYIEITKALVGFDGYFQEAEQGHFADASKADFPLATGQAIFIKQPSELTVLSHGGLFVKGEAGDKPIDNYDHPRVMQYVHCKRADGSMLTICNLHGCLTRDEAGGSPKADSPIRTEQYRRIQEFIDSLDHPYIIVGDFNTRPEIKALIDFENGKRNLVKEYNVKTVRSHLYAGREKWNDHLGDYVIVSPEVKVIHFKVIDNGDVSDHLPMALGFE